MESLIPIIIKILAEYGYVLVFLGTIVAGEVVILAAVFLASLDILNIYLVILCGLSGIIVSDNLWYLLGVKLNKRLGFFKKYFYLSRYHKKIAVFREKFNSRYRQFLVMSKFVYGLRILTLLTSGYQRIPYKHFVLFNLIGTISWMLVVVVLGYIMGMSWNYLGQYNDYARYLVLFGLLILFMLRYLFQKLINYNHYGQRN